MKSKGPLLTGFAKGLAQAIPERFLASIKLKRTSQAVPNGTEPDSISTTVLESDVKITNTNEDRKENIERDAEIAWPTFTGQEFDRQLNIGIPYTETIKPTSGLTIAASEEATPLNSALTLIKSSVLGNVLDSIHMKFYTPERVSLPDRLLSVTPLYSKTSDYAIGQGRGSTFSAESSVSASIMAELGLDIKPGFNDLVDGTTHLFYLPVSNVTKSTILTKVRAAAGDNTIDLWPTIRPVAHRIIITGASASVSKSFARTGTSSSQSGSTRNGITTRAINIPPTIHDTIPISTTGNSVAASTVDVPESITYTYNSGGWHFTAGSLGPPPTAGKWEYTQTDSTVTEPNPLYIALNLAVAMSTDQLDATSPAVFPTGTYLVDCSVSLYGYGYAQVLAKTVTITAAHV